MKISEYCRWQTVGMLLTVTGIILPLMIEYVYKRHYVASSSATKLGEIVGWLGLIVLAPILSYATLIATASLVHSELSYYLNEANDLDSILLRRGGRKIYRTCF